MGIIVLLHRAVVKEVISMQQAQTTTILIFKVLLLLLSPGRRASLLALLSFSALHCLPSLSLEGLDSSEHVYWLILSASLKPPSAHEQ